MNFKMRSNFQDDFPVSTVSIMIITFTIAFFSKELAYFVGLALYLHKLTK